MMIKILGFFLVIYFGNIGSGYSKESCWTCDAKPSLLDRANCLNGIAEKKLKRLPDSKRLLDCSLSYWKSRDGAVGHVLAKTFFQILKKRPELLLEQFSGSPSDLSDWIELLPNSFQGLASSSVAAEKEIGLRSLRASKNRARFKQTADIIEMGLNRIKIPSVVEKLE